MKKIQILLYAFLMGITLLGAEKVIEIKASHDDGNKVENILDENFQTRWSAADEAWIILELGKSTELRNIDIAFHKGNERKTKFKIETSNDGAKWEKCFEGESTGLTDKFERYRLNSSKAKVIKITGYGNSSNKWNSISEVKINNEDKNIKYVDEIKKENINKQENLKSYSDIGKIYWKKEITDNWKTEWNIMGDKKFGLDENLSVIKDKAGNFFRVKYPKGSIAPSSVEKLGAPLGGAQFYVNLPSKEAVELSYMLRFSPNFKFAKGGKLPGLYGGDRNASGKRIPTEDSGFSTRMMWRENGAGYIYAYLPSSNMHGTYLGKWQFEKDKWHKIAQRVYLNEEGKSDGKIEIYLDDKLVTEIDNLKFRNFDKLKVDGLFFSTFFGGSDKSWESQDDVYMDYKEFTIKSLK